MKKLLLLLLFSAICSAQTTHIFSALDTTNPFTGLNTFSSNPGSFGAAQNNFNLQQALGVNPVSTLVTNFDTLGTFVCCLTDSFSVAATVPSGATGIQADAIGAYIVNNSHSLGGGVGGGAVALYGVAGCGNASGAKCWGLNTVLTSMAVGQPCNNCYSAELDFNTLNTNDTGAGLLINGLHAAQSTSLPAIQINKPIAGSCNGCGWTGGILMQTGSSNLAQGINLGATSSAANSNGYEYWSNGVNSGGTGGQLARWRASSNGDFQIIPTSGFAVLTGGAMVGSNTSSNTDLNGQLTFSSSTTSSSYTFTGTYTSAPICTITPLADPVGRLWISTLSTTTLQLTDSSSASITVDYQCSKRN